MSLSTLFEVLIAILGVASAGYLIYAYYEFLKDIAHKENKCVIIVTHSKKLEQAADIVLELHNGKLIEK